MSIKVATTDQLIAMIDYAVRNDLNRQPDAQTRSNLDPEGLHIVTDLMIHDHANGVEVAPHMRCQIHAKVKDQTDPAVFTLDTDLDLFGSLVEAEEVRAAIGI